MTTHTPLPVGIETLAANPAPSVTSANTITAHWWKADLFRAAKLNGKIDCHSDMLRGCRSFSQLWLDKCSIFTLYRQIERFWDLWVCLVNRFSMRTDLVPIPTPLYPPTHHSQLPVAYSNCSVVGVAVTCVMMGLRLPGIYHYMARLWALPSTLVSDTELTGQSVSESTACCCWKKHTKSWVRFAK